ncbi:MAG: hypothetical protein P4L50_07705 [Anaerolineaceae bacterium]|nr:hypothetical protein [Anaerolineaceae bacterium]
MLRSNRLVYLWCALIGGIALSAILPTNSQIYKSFADYDSNRWCHFLAYTSVVAMPFVLRKRKQGFLLFFVPPVFCIVLEMLHAYIPGLADRVQNTQADLFGAAAGVLLGLNLRVMRNATKPIGNVTTTPSDRDTF